MRILLLSLVALGIFVISVHLYDAVASDGEESKLKMHKFRTHRFNGGSPIVFTGNLFSETGFAIKHADIIIKSDGPCPADQIIAQGKTDKRGRFWILTQAKVWDPKDNMVLVHAEYPGNERYLPSFTETQPVVVSSRPASICK